MTATPALSLDDGNEQDTRLGFEAPLTRTADQL